MMIMHLKILLAAALLCGASMSGVAAPSETKLDVPDTTLLDQNGREVRFKSDVLGEKTVAIQFIFTTCRAICPVMGAAFAKLQDRLGDRLGRDISLVSVSIDPVTDTPARMKQWGEQFGARPGWNLLTGEKGKIENLLKALEATNHNAPVVLLGNLRTGEWVRAYDDITAPDRLYTELINLADKPARAEVPRQRRVDRPERRKVEALRGPVEGKSRGGECIFLHVPGGLLGDYAETRGAPGRGGRPSGQGCELSFHLGGSAH